MHIAARTLSFLLHPLLMPTITLWAVLFFDPQAGFFFPLESRWLLFTMVVVMTVVFPVMSVLFLRRAGLVSNLELPRREERIAPYLITMLYLSMCLYLLLRTPLHPIVFALFAGIMGTVFLCALITLRWKISAHMAGIGGLLGALVAVQLVHGVDLFVPIVVGILLGGLLGTARLLSSDHSQAQLLAGTLLGGACTFCAILAPALP